MKQIYILVLVNIEGEFLDLVATSFSKGNLRDIIKTQQLGGSWDSSFLNYKIPNGDTLHIYSRYVF
jgi:hypothetical protein